jgi:diguanylate cyclase (GGDEF)-like protein
MYDESLAQGILEVLNKAFPENMALPDLKRASQEFAHLPDEDWLLAIDALNKDGLVDGIFSRAGAKKVLRAAANLEITASGREMLRRASPGDEYALKDESPDLDSFLQIYNRGRLDNDLPQLVRSANSDHPSSLIIIDIDNFKNVNDTHGHAMGDVVVKKTAALVQSVCKGKGHCYRYSGDELVVLLPNYTVDEAFALGERVRVTICEADFQPFTESVTVSAGVSAYPETTRDGTKLFEHADSALYDAKAEGGDCVCKAGRAEPSRGQSPSLAMQGVPRAEIARRIEAAELRVSISQGVSPIFILEARNESDLEISILKITLEKNGIVLTDPARPKENDDWNLPPKAARPASWHAHPNPAIALTRMHPNEGANFTTDIDIVLGCEILGKAREFRQRVLVKVIVRNAEIRQIAG